MRFFGYIAVVILAYFACIAPVAFGQGTVTFLNGVLTSPPDRLVRSLAGDPLVGTNFFAQLYYGAAGAPEGSLVPVSSPPTTFRSPTTTQPGTWLGGSRVLNGFIAGSEASLQVRVWDSIAGVTWEEALAAGFNGTQHGVSSVFSHFVPAGGPESVFYMQNFRGFTLVPEPSVVVLVLAGGIGLWLLRRRVRERIDC